MKENFYLYNLMTLVRGRRIFRGWGRKRSGKFAVWCRRVFGGKVLLMEDGFIRSVGLGVEGAPSFSVIEDDVGIYYDATVPSKLENLLSRYDFESDLLLMEKAEKAMRLMREHGISKYNSVPFAGSLKKRSADEKSVLIVAQTAGDASLKYGMAEAFTTKQMIEEAAAENPDASLYIKIHPDVLSGKKKSDIRREEIPPFCTILEQNSNPIALLAAFDKIYTKTSAMGMEALILGKEVVCYGMPFYAGWGVTMDRQVSKRRCRRLRVEEIFAAAYILYPSYFNPYTGRTSDIIDTISEIIVQREKRVIREKEKR